MRYDLKALEFDKVLEKLMLFAKTNYAKRQIMKICPIEDYEQVLVLNDETQEAFTALIRLSDIPLGGLYDVKNSLERARIGGLLEPTELLDIASMFNCISAVIKYFKGLETIKISTPRLNAYVEQLKMFPNIRTAITLAITEDARVADNASRELFTIRRGIQSLENKLRSKLNEILISKSSMLTENLIVMRNDRMCLPVKIEYKNSFKGIVHDISSSNTTCYIEPAATIETSNQIESYLAMEKKEVETILRNLSLLVASEADALLEDLNLLTQLDIIFAKAQMAKYYDYHPVKINQNHQFDLKKAKHPLIDAENVVPIDVELGAKYSTLIITGPNTGGKTVALKTVGLLHVMMMCGLMVPAHPDSSLSVFREILVDIGDEQSIEQSLSTFSAHLTKMIDIIEHTTFESLILLDELGSGTDPKEGSCLAIAMIDDMKARGAKIMVTTHYSDLKNYAYNQSDVQNASVEFNTSTLMPTYRLLIGIPGKSNAIEIASRLGLKPQIIEACKKYMSLESSTSSNLLSNLEDEMTKIRDKEAELEHKLEVYEGLNQELSLEKIKITKQTNKIIEAAKIEASKILNQSKEEAENLIQQLKSFENADYKEHELATIKHKMKNLNVVPEEQSLFEEELFVGDYVYIKPYDKNGTINSIKKDRYTVQMGQFSMEFTKKDLVKSTKPKEKKVKETRMSGYTPASHIGLSLDLRGKRYEEVEFLMDQYLDQAILANMESVSIIHGFGTGTIRNAVQTYLKKCSFVKSYRYGGEGEGLNGVTIVKLK